jgi:hypothetical protein
MTGAPENEGGGAAPRTGPRRASRAFNAEFVDIQNLHRPARQAADAADPEAVRTRALHMQFRDTRDVTIDPQVGEQLDFVAPVSEAGADQIVRRDFRIVGEPPAHAALR